VTDATAAIEAEVRASGARLDAEAEIIDCDPELADTAAFCAHYGYPPEQSANTILVASKRPVGSYAVCVVLATSRLDVNKRVCELLGVRKASFASAEVTADLTGMMIGGVTPFALPPDLPLYVDEAVMAHPWIILGGGSRSIKVKIDPGALIELGALVVPDLAKPAV
jgi:prolyl-tRNA editing enzyme YbaK/EbsC (Cys-tRNA(Pro) deacylase)